VSAPAKPERRLVFKHTVEALFDRAFGRDVKPELREQFRALGLFSPAIDAELFGRCFATLRDHVRPGVPLAQAEREMGQRFLASYFETAMGAMVGVWLKVLSVEQALQRAPQSLMSGANFIHARVELVGPRLAQVQMTDFSTSPEFLCGVVSELLRRTGATADVSVTKVDGRALTLRVTW
jgi:uncharacterized protein (TIGR02265 family)